MLKMEFQGQEINFWAVGIFVLFIVYLLSPRIAFLSLIGLFAIKGWKLFVKY